VSYNDEGGYGHPDHVFAHRIGRAVAAALEVPFWEIVSAEPGSSDPRPAPAGDEAASPAQPHTAAGLELHDVTPWQDRKIAALRAYATQLTVDGDEIVHVGGQRQPIDLVETFRLLR